MSFLEYFHKAGYTTESAWKSGSVYQGLQEAPSNKSTKAAPSLENRYMDEDVGYGLVPFREVARLVGVRTPVIDSLIRIASIERRINFLKEGLTLKKMGLGEIDVTNLKNFLYEGTNSNF